MNQLDLYLPFSLMPEEMARDLQRELTLPSLSMLLGRGSEIAHHIDQGFSRALPHEARLTSAANTTSTSPAIAGGLARAFNVDAKHINWSIVQPVHIHIARDHLVLTDTRQLQLSESHSRALFETAQKAFDVDGKTLIWLTPTIWLLHAEEWRDLQTATPDAACGHNVDIWMPKGDEARAWRRLQNEVQMDWHDHAVNDERAMQGLKPVNSIWLWGTGNALSPAKLFALDTHMPIARAMGAHEATLDAVLAEPDHAVLLLDALLPSALAGDWGTWIDQFNALETQWFAPLLEQVKSGGIRKLVITVNDQVTLRDIACSAGSLRKFWKKPSLSSLLA